MRYHTTLAIGTQHLAVEAKSLPELEREVILAAHTLCLGNKAMMARELGISLATVKRKLKEYNSGTAEGEGEGSNPGSVGKKQE